MAVGITHKDSIISKAISAELEIFSSEAMPKCKDNVTLQYPNKMKENDILKPIETDFGQVIQSNEFYRSSIVPNSLILADNYYAIKALQNDYQGKVRLIYLDPPYGTGMTFQSRKLEYAYDDFLGTASWLEFMRRRLILMRELLTEDGSIYVHIGHQMLFHLKIIMDEVFGVSNFRNLIVRKKCSSKNYTKKQYPNLNDYILFYTKSNSHIWNQPSTQASEEWIVKEYPKIDEKGRYKLVPIHAPGERNGETGKPWKGLMPPLGKHWQFTPSKLDELDKNGEIHWSRNGNPRRKVYLTPNKTLQITDYWDKYRDAHHQSIKITGYPTEKNFEMLKVIVSASSNPNDIVLDPFCGSGTTLHAARDLDRRWIGIDQSFQAIETTLTRLKKGLYPMGDYVKKDPDVITQSLFSIEGKELNLFTSDEIYKNCRDEVNALADIFS